MKKCSKLLSISIFIELDNIDDKELSKEVDDAILKDKKEELLVDFKELFDSKQRVYTRAVMANVLSELPVFFINMNEVVEYINTQISLCKNNNEKMACYAIITDMISQD